MAIQTQNLKTQPPKVKVYKIKNDIVIVRNHANIKIDRKWVIDAIRTYHKEGTPIRYTTTEWYIREYNINSLENKILIIDIYKN